MKLSPAQPARSLCFVLALSCSASAERTPTSAEVPMQRLTPQEYNRTIQHLFALDQDGLVPNQPEDDEIDTEWPWRFPPETKVDGFEGLAEAQAPSPYLVEQYQRAAAAFAPLSLRTTTFFTCPDFTSLGPAEQASCARDSSVRFAMRAWRRPISDEERTRITSLYDQFLDTHGPQSAAVATVEAILQTPQFLYRPAFGEPSGTPGVNALTPWELATRMSYFLWDSMPDEVLFQAAADGKLSTPKDIRKQARRMIRDERAQSAVVHFHKQWMSLEKLHTSNPDLDAHAPRYMPHLVELDTPLFPEEKEEMWSAAVVGARVALEHETERFITRTLLEKSGSLADLLTSTDGFASNIRLDEEPGEEPVFSTGALHGVDARGKRDSNLTTTDGNFQYFIDTYRVDWPRSQRAGIIASPAWLMGEAHPVHPAPIFRGVFVLERLLCEPIGQPPPAAAGQVPPDATTATGTNRDRITAITSPTECAACHDRINAVGFAFEQYDSFGGYRDTDNGQPIDASGEYTTFAGDALSFNSGVELMQQLATLDQVQDCYAQHWTRYALGHGVAADDPRMVEIAAANRDNKGKVEDLLVEIVASDLFRFRDGGAQ